MSKYRVSIIGKLKGGNRVEEVLLTGIGADSSAHAREQAKKRCKAQVARFEVRGRRFVAVKVIYPCPDSPNGQHVFSHDEEYAQKHHLEQGPLCCEHCGDEPRMDVGATIEITQDGSEVGEDKRLKLGAKFIIADHRFKAVGGSGAVGIWKLQVQRGTETFETTWLRAKVMRLAPVQCPGCGNAACPNMDGTFNRHGSLGWSCDGKTKSLTGL